MEGGGQVAENFLDLRTGPSCESVGFRPSSNPPSHILHSFFSFFIAYFVKVIGGVKESDRCDLFLSHLFLPSFFLALKGKGKEWHGDQEGVSWPLSSLKQLHHPYWGKALSKTVLLKLRVSIHCTGKEKRTVKSPSCV